VKKSPLDVRAHYALARVHSLALFAKAKTVFVYERQGVLPRVDHTFHDRPRKDKRVPTTAELEHHLEQALEHFRDVLRLARADRFADLPPLCELGIAVTYEAAAGALHRRPPDWIPAEVPAEDEAEYENLLGKLANKDESERAAAETKLKKAGLAAFCASLPLVDHENERVRAFARGVVAQAWREVALPHYLRAFEAARTADARLTAMPLPGLSSLVSYEAASSWVRLVEARGAKPSERTALEETKAHLARLKNLPRASITPIVFPLDRARPLASLLSGRTVRFDLDGDREVERRPWVNGDTGILVWDPRARGTIRSGRQLFGSVTWWMFWPTGYDALDALDDDRDGALTGGELAGLAVWCDADGDGHSDPAEVRPVAELGIAAIATRAPDRADGCPANRRGLRLANGRILPTYDWIVAPVDG
jgi:hypothetical protein